MKAKTPTEGCAAVILLAFASAISMPISAWSLMLLWGWFVAPAFQVPPIGFFVAWGLCIVAAFITNRHSEADAQAEEDLDILPTILSRFSRAVIASLLLAFLGWVIQFFV